MNYITPKNTDILSWDPEDMDSYWHQCRAFDNRPYDTRCLLGSSCNQAESQRAFSKMLKQFTERRRQKRTF